MNAANGRGKDLHEATHPRNGRLWQRVNALYPIARSLTGDGVRATLEIVQRELPIVVHDIATGTEVLDWTIPDEWNLRRATLTAPDGTVVADSDAHPLHVVGYSTPVDAMVERDELEAHLHSLPDQPDAIPYRTTYYHRTWGFCIADRVRKTLPDGLYRATVDATLAPGSLTYGELLIPGETDEEILLSTHVCHPQMANDNASGIAALVEVGLRLREARGRRHSVRLLFIPGSLGAIAWLGTHSEVTPRIRAGLVLTGLGDGGPLRYKRSRRGDTVTDAAAALMLAERGEDLGTSLVDFSPYGYDERQFCSPGFDLAVGRLTRGVHGEYPEYHTSLDDLAFIAPEALADSVGCVMEIVDAVDRDRTYRNLSPYGEPQLGRRGLYTAVGGTMNSKSVEMGLLWVLNQSDGHHSLLDIAARSQIPFASIVAAANALVAADLLAAA